MDMKFCKLGHRWCPFFVDRGENSICSIVSKDNGEGCADGDYLINLHTECPFTNRLCICLKDTYTKQGYFFNHKH